ncbi:MAG: hypothetical protein M3Y33_08695 [Actinomycetota bacterium]|nr:hypothetical protein [Actinomycetota bacterium]
MHSATRVVPAWQDIHVGDQVRLAADVGLTVAATDRGQALVSRGGLPMGTLPCPYDFTWAWILRTQPDGTTRLVVRERYAYNLRWAPVLIEPVQVISFVMTQRMLRGIKERAETGGLTYPGAQPGAGAQRRSGSSPRCYPASA